MLKHFVRPDLGPKCLQRYQQMTKVPLEGKKLNTKQLVQCSRLRCNNI